jgi:TonB-linked SusC/RagA family outer membrane protein
VSAGEHTLRITLLGFAFQTKVVTVAAGRDVVADFKIVRSAQVLEQVVTLATGEQRALELGHTIAVVKAASLIAEAPVFNVSDMLTSRVPGVQITGQTGLAGTTSPIRIRGLNSFSVSNNPLVIVDGARVESTPSLTGYGNSSRSFPQYGRLGDLNMAEVESIEVLKGPSAGTLYGTDAANGVILIKTKRGSAGDTRWNVFGETGLIVEDTDRMPTSVYGWGHSTTTGAIVQCSLANVVAGACVQDSITTWSPLKHPETTPIAHGHRGQAGVQASGGVGRFRYFAAGTWERELGFMRMPLADQAVLKAERNVTSLPEEQLRPNNLIKNNFRANLSTDLGSRADIDLSNGVTFSDFRQSDYEPIRAGYWSSGSRKVGYDGWGFGSRMGDFFSKRNAEHLRRYISSLNTNWRPTDWLATRGTFGVDFSNNITDQLEINGQGPPRTTGRIGRRSQWDDVITQYSMQVGATATKPVPRFAELSSKTSVGAQLNRRTLIQTQITGIGLPPGSETMTGAQQVTAGELHADAVVVGSYIEQQLSWHDRLFVTVAARADGASTFGKDLHTTIYPKFSLSWIPSSEPGLPKIPGVGSLRIRVASGASGVQPQSTAGISTVRLLTAAVGGTTVNAVTSGTFGNPGVKPERQTETEVGFDLDAVAGRLHAEITGYSRKSSDALVAQPFAASVGGGSRFVNIGSVSNRGLEAMVRAIVIESNKVGLDLSLNYSTNANKLVSVGPNIQTRFFDNSNAYEDTRHRVGYPLFGLWSRRILSYTDVNGDHIIAGSEVAVADTESYYGPSSPTKNVTLTTGLSLWRDLVRVTTNLDWRGGYQRLQYASWVACTLIVNCASSNDPNSPLVDQAAAQAYLAHASNGGYIYDGTFTRLREVSVVVRVPSQLLQRVGARTGSFSLAGRNLFLWTNWPGPDPEVNSRSGDDATVAFPTAPIPKYFIARLSLAF